MLTTQQAMTIERLWSEGISGKEIGRRLGITRREVYLYANSHRWSCPVRWGDDKFCERREVVKRIALNGGTYHDVMHEVGVAKSTAGRLLTSARLELGI